MTHTSSISKRLVALGLPRVAPRISVAAASLAVVVALAGCTTGGTSTGMPGMDHSGMTTPSANVQGEVTMADSMFVMMMIPHHEQAIEMSDIILAKSGIAPPVLELAQQIKDAQDPEIALMEGWLDEWGMPSSSGMDGMEGMVHGDGMMSQDDMDALAAAEGSEAARLFLEQMIAHHEGAIDMAEEELEGGADAQVLALAQTIIESQTAEIATMRQLLTETEAE